MIYAKLTNGQALIILEPINIERLRVGQPATTPDDSIIIAFTPDMQFTSTEMEKFAKAGQLDGKRFSEIMLESTKRAEVRDEALHPYKVLIQEGAPAK